VAPFNTLGLGKVTLADVIAIQPPRNGGGGIDPTTVGNAQFLGINFGGVGDFLGDVLRDPTVQQVGKDLFGIGQPPGGSGIVSSQPCVPPFFRQPDGSCKFDIDPGAGTGLPGGPGNIASSALGEILGVNGRQPGQTARMTCGPGMVLGIDNLCYPKQLLQGRSRFRKNKKARKPPISTKDWRCLMGAASAKDKMFDIAKKAGLHVSKSRPRARKKS